MKLSTTQRGLSAGQTLTVVDPTGSQVSDFFAFFADDHGEWLSRGRTIDYGKKVFFITGDVLYSNRRAPMATIIGDTRGRHDFLLTPAASKPSTCSTPSWMVCHTQAVSRTLCEGLSRFSVAPDQISTTFNIFMNVDRPQRSAAHRPTNLKGRRPPRPTR